MSFAFFCTMIHDLPEDKISTAKTSAFITAPSTVNNNDAIYFLPKMISNQPTVKSVMTSFSSLCFSANIFGLSCRATGITILGTSSSGKDNFL